MTFLLGLLAVFLFVGFCWLFEDPPKPKARTEAVRPLHLRDHAEEARKTAESLWLDDPLAFFLHPEGPLSDTTPEEWIGRWKASASRGVLANSLATLPDAHQRAFDNAQRYAACQRQASDHMNGLYAATGMLQSAACMQQGLQNQAMMNDLMNPIAGSPIRVPHKASLGYFGNGLGIHFPF